MAEDINLLPEVTEKEVKKGVYQRTVNMAAIIALLIVAAILLALFGYQFFLASTAKRIDSQTKSAEQEISNQRSKEITRRALVGKLDVANIFLASSTPYSEAMGKILGVFKKSGITLVESTFKGAGQISISGEAKSSNNFGKLVDGLTDEKLSDTFDRVRLVSLTGVEKEPYKFTIDLRFLKKGLMEATGSAQNK